MNDNDDRRHFLGMAGALGAGLTLLAGGANTVAAGEGAPVKHPGPNDPPIDTGLKDPFIIADYSTISGVQCPCGTSHRAFVRPDNTIATLHRVDISVEAKAHYHKYLTEMYYFLECDGPCSIELNGQRYPVKPGVAILIRPGTKHRAIGKATVLNVVTPPFDKADEWFD